MGYLGLALVFCVVGGGVHRSEGLIVIFWGAFASASGVFVLAGGGGGGLDTFLMFPNFLRS